MLRYYVDLLDTLTDGKIGDGPITTATEINFTRRLSRAGTFSMTIPASQYLADYLALRQKVSVYWITPAGQRREVGRGVIDRITPEFDGNALVWRVEGDDILRELAWLSPGYLNIWNGVNGPTTHSNAVSTIAAYAPDWTFVADSSPANNTIYYTAQFDSVLTVLGDIAAQARNHFRLSDYGREVEFVSPANFDASAFVAIAPGSRSVPDATTLFLSDIEEERDSYDLITRIYPYGENLGSAGLFLTMSNTTRSAPSGYTLSAGSNYIQNDDAIALYGTVSRHQRFSEIRKIGTSAPFDDQAASDALYDVALRELQQRSQINRSWRLHLIGAQDVVPVGTVLRVMYRKELAGQLIYNVNDYFNVLESTIRFRPGSAPETISLLVSSVDRYPQRDGDWAIQAEKQRAFRS